jgi:spermidine synthase
MNGETENPKPAPYLSIASSRTFAAGLVSAALQTVALRELGVAFNGSELVVGAVLSAWLFLYAVGVALGGRLARREGPPGPVVSVLFAAAALLGPATTVAIRFLPVPLSEVPGAAVGFQTILWSSAAALLPLCIVLGALFPACLGEMSRGRGDVRSAARTYVVEAFGFFAGGALVTFVFLPGFPASMMVGASSAACLFCAGLGIARLPVRASVMVLALALVPVALVGAPSVDAVTRGAKHPGEEVVKTVDSRYGVFTVTRRKDQVSFYTNGGRLWSSDTPVRAEELGHLALLAHERPERVALVGSGARGVLRVVLEHPVRRVDCVDLDPVPLREGEAFLSPGDRAALADPRVHLHFLDGRTFVKKSSPGAFEVLVVDVPDPSTGFLNRFYTAEFFAEARECLSPGGLLVLTLSGASGYTPRTLRALFATVARTLRTAFGDIDVIEGDQAGILFLAGEPARKLDAAELGRRAAGRALRSHVVSPRALRVLTGRQAPALLLQESLSGPGARINRDLAPVSTSHQFAFWDLRFACRREGGSPVPFWTLLGLFVAVGLGVLTVRFRGVGPAGLGVLWLLFGAGASAMIFEVGLLLAFQAVYGFVWGIVGLLAGAFMLGGVAGGWAGARILDDLRAPRTRLALCAGSLAILLAGSALGLDILGALPGLLPWLAFLLLLGGAGFLLGLLYVLGVAAIGTHGGRGASAVYAADMVGSSAGGAFAAALAIPALGIPGAIALAAGLVFLGSLLVVMGRVVGIKK